MPISSHQLEATAKQDHMHDESCQKKLIKKRNQEGSNSVSPYTYQTSTVTGGWSWSVHSHSISRLPSSPQSLRFPLSLPLYVCINLSFLLKPAASLKPRGCDTEKESMGCASSKRVEAAVAADVYRPPPTSVALFDVSTIQEPWLITTITEEDPKQQQQQQQQQEKKAITPLPLPLLEKIESYELSPHSWSEVSKALEDLKSSLHQPPPPPSKSNTPQLPPPSSDHKKPPQKTSSFHTLEELDTKLSSPTNKKKPPSSPPRSLSPPRPPPPELAGFKPVKENSFIIRDRQERESKKAGGDPAAAARWRRRDPLEGYPERCPPGNGDGVVLYTTTLRGVRRTFEDCERARRAVEAHSVEAGVEVEERDVSLHGDYLKEVRELVGEGAAVPRLFIRGRYVGGVEEVVELGETGKLREMLRWVAARGERGKGGWRECEGCGGARFVPCLECNGSCKVVAEDGEGLVRCGECNENGLMLCPLCH